jgi:hypothetical protein
MVEKEDSKDRRIEEKEDSKKQKDGRKRGLLIMKNRRKGKTGTLKTEGWKK